MTHAQLVDAMKIIAAVQDQLGAAGFPCGAWGPCKDGIDGRWGQDSQAAYTAFKLSKGLTPQQSQEPLEALGVPVSAMEFQTAVGVWNNWRNKHQVGSRAYEEAANLALEQATGITAATCAGAEPAGDNGTGGEDQGNGSDLALPPTTASTGWPWWLWLILGLGVAGAAGGGIWAYYKYGKKRKPKSLSGFGKAEGAEIGEEEFGSDKSDDVDDEDDDVS